ncbi:hypothetical protein ACJX0J_039198 [Zea mays]
MAQYNENLLNNLLKIPFFGIRRIFLLRRTWLRLSLLFDFFLLRSFRSVLGSTLDSAHMTRTDLQKVLDMFAQEKGPQEDEHRVIFDLFVWMFIKNYSNIYRISGYIHLGGGVTTHVGRIIFGVAFIDEEGFITQLTITPRRDGQDSVVGVLWSDDISIIKKNWAIIL